MATGCKPSPPTPQQGEQTNAPSPSHAPDSSAPESATAEEKSFGWASVEPSSIDPAFTVDHVGWWIVPNLFEGLMTYDRGNEPPVLGVAAKYEANPKATLWRFDLRADARWSDGSPVTAHDFVYAWRRVVDPSTASPNANDLAPLAGAREIMASKNPDLTTLGVVAQAERTLLVRLAHPQPNLLSLLTTPAFAPVPRHAIETHGRAWTKPENIITNGAFTLSDWLPRDELTFRASPSYWDSEQVKLGHVVMHHAESAEAALALYETGKIDWLRTLSPQRVHTLRAARDPTLHIDPTLCTHGLTLNLNHPPLNTPQVRRALALAIDKERIVKHTLDRGDRIADHLVPPLFAGATGYVSPDRAGEFDPDQAQSLLSQAGYPGGAGFPKLTLLFNTHETNRAIATEIASALKKHLKIELFLQNVEFKEYLARLASGDFELARAGPCGLPDPLMWVEMFRSTSVSNYGGYRNADLDQLLDEAAAASDLEQRNDRIAKAEALVLADQAMVPIYHSVNPYLLRPRIGGFASQAMEVHLWKYLYIQALD